jgi:hypothetical protein
MRTSPLVSQPMTDQTTATDVAQPEPEGPSDEELTQFLFENFRGPIEFLCDAEEEAHLMIRSHVKFARAVLARWGTPNSEETRRSSGDAPQSIPVLTEGTQVIEPTERTLLVPVAQPIPVRERLPGPEDCQFNSAATVGSCWCWTPPASTMASGYWSFEPLEWAEDATHWLPAHALPVPTND